jgi:hypothetical protein
MAADCLLFKSGTEQNITQQYGGYKLVRCACRSVDILSTRNHK